MLLSAERLARREANLATVHGDYKDVETPSIGLEFLPEEFRSTTLDSITQRSNEFFQHTTPSDYQLVGNKLSFSSNIETLVEENNLVHGEIFRARGFDRAVVVLPYWNAERMPFNRIARILAKAGVTALRLSLPYHDERQPVDWNHARHMVSANIGLTISAVRQAALDTRCAVDWLAHERYRSIGIVGVSLGSCIAGLVASHDVRVKAVAQLLMASNFAEVVWTGLATKHIRESLEQFTSLDALKRYWSGISPDSYVDDLAEKGGRVLLLTGAHDPVFLPHLGEQIAALYDKENVPFEWTKYRCGHYTLGDFPYSALALFRTIRFMRSSLG